ncbi:MAG: eicosanoid and glutathione metabolism membrane-associated protein [bacterium]|nr:MAG: eicosanoid and glutathione metabolism membrane-associated protein [bacterium]
MMTITGSIRWGEKTDGDLRNDVSPARRGAVERPVDPAAGGPVAFGNAAEYIPPYLAILILLALLDFQPVWIHAVGGAMLLGRVLHAWGLSQTKQPSFGRMSGMILTQLALIGGAGALIGCAFGAF